MNNYAPKHKLAIVGARGYSGLDLARILLNHPDAELTTVFSSDGKDFSLSSYLPEKAARNVETKPLSTLSAELKNLHTIFLATPAEASLELAPKIIESGVNVIDLSGAFRLEESLYPKWYGFEHTEKKLLTEAEYGLVPFASPFKKNQGLLVSNPGCFVTSVLMGILPLLKSGVIDPTTLVIDSKSGTSGAGKKAAENLLFTEVDGECLPYKIGGHQHFPEICAYAEKFSGVKIDPHFSTSLIPVRRGIISGIYATLAPGKTETDVEAAFKNAYAGYELLSHGKIQSTDPMGLSLKKVVGSARTQIRYKIDGKKLYIYSLIDNLMKGAASQAVENFNRLLDRAPETSLSPLEGTL